MADRTTGELEAVKESPISGLPEILELYDDTLIPVEQNGVAMHMTGQQWRGFGEKTAEIYVQVAVDAAEAAKNSEKSAAESEREAKEYSGKPAIIQENEEGFKTWWTWDATAQDYVDTGEIAVSDVNYAWFWIDEKDGSLYEYYDKGYTGPEFSIKDGADLEVYFVAY